MKGKSVLCVKAIRPVSSTQKNMSVDRSVTEAAKMGVSVLSTNEKNNCTKNASTDDRLKKRKHTRDAALCSR